MTMLVEVDERFKCEARDLKLNRSRILMREERIEIRRISR